MGISKEDYLKGLQRAKDYADKKFEEIEILSQSEMLQEIIDTGIFTDILADNGVIYTDDNGKVMVI